MAIDMNRYRLDYDKLLATSKLSLDGQIQLANDKLDRLNAERSDIELKTKKIIYKRLLDNAIRSDNGVLNNVMSFEEFCILLEQQNEQTITD